MAARIGLLLAGEATVHDTAPDFAVNDHSPIYGHFMLNAAMTRGYANYSPAVKDDDEALRTAFRAQHHCPLQQSIRTVLPSAVHTGFHTAMEHPLTNGNQSQLGTSIQSPTLIAYSKALVKAYAKADPKPDSKEDGIPDLIGYQLPIAMFYTTACSTGHITPNTKT